MMADQQDVFNFTQGQGRSSRHVEHLHFETQSTNSSTANGSRSTSAMTSPLSADFKIDTDHPDVSKLPSPTHHPLSSSESKHLESNDDDTSSIAEPFQRNCSPNSDMKRNKGAIYEKVGETGVCKMHKFSLYETATRYYIVGADVLDQRFRILKVDRTADAGVLSIAEDEIVYTRKEMTQLLNAVDDGNKSTGGLKLKCSTWGLLGFIHFTGAYYMLMVTKRSQIAMIGGHFVYQVDGTELVPLTTSAQLKADSKNTDEARFLSILHNLDLRRSFYFSYSYDITRTLQNNICAERECITKGVPYPHPQDHNSMFVWNDYLLQPAMANLKNTYDWCLPVIHGYVNQSAIDIYGRTVYMTVIARRSRHFAGARFLKRGANDMGYVANDVETEQIVAEILTTSLHGPGAKLFTSPNITSYVQHRGSIPLFWTQDNAGVTPKPPIELNLVDPFYSAAGLHFDNLFERYGAPVYALNLVKSRERTPRESKLLHEYTTAIEYLNQFLPEGKKIIHKPWDMSRASKSRDQDVIGTLESIAEEVVTTTGFFHNGDGLTTMPRIQNGVARTNCIDCLDRTNAAQFVIGKRALGHQLHALGILRDTKIAYDTDCINSFTHLYHAHGDTIAVQYGGSQLVNTMETYRRTNQWTSQSRDMVESFKRYYNNSFLDGQRQEAYNLFLGNYVWSPGGPLLWDLASDYHLHHTDPRLWKSNTRRSYQNWYTPKFIETRTLPAHTDPCGQMTDKPLSFFDDYWIEYYKPLAISSLVKVFSYIGKTKSTMALMPNRSQDHRYDLSPFKVRTDLDQEVPETKKALRKGVTIREPSDEPSELIDDDNLSMKSGVTKRISIQNWLQPIRESPQRTVSPVHGIMKEPPVSPTKDRETKKLDKSKAAQWTFTQVVQESLDPSVSEIEQKDYVRYISHPQTLPLVVSSEILPGESNAEFVDYMNGSWRETGMVFNAESGVTDEDLAEYADFLVVAENPLTVTDDDLPKKRYKAYRKWLLGKSLFKEQPVD